MIETLPLRRIFVPHFFVAVPHNAGSTALLHRGESTALRCDAQYEQTVEVAPGDDYRTWKDFICNQQYLAWGDTTWTNYCRGWGLRHARSQRLPMLDHQLQGDEPLVTMDIGPVRGPDTLRQGVGSIEKDSFEVLVIQRERQAHVLASDRALRRYLEFVVEARPWE